ncbi:MAG TPA: hypothetical protein VF457_02010 [Burkholderiaceae bacterium]
MTRSIDDLVAALRALAPTDDASDNEHRLNEAFDGFHLMADREEALPEVFFLLERHAGADFGAPILLLRELEAFAAYPRLLAASLERQPTELTVVMCNRLLNTPLPRDRRQAWLARLNAVASHPCSPPSLRETTARLLDFQASRSGRLAP